MSTRRIAEAGRARLTRANLAHRPNSLMYACPSCMFDEERSRFTATSHPRCCGKCALDGKKELFADATNKYILLSTWMTETSYQLPDQEI